MDEEVEEAVGEAVEEELEELQEELQEDEEEHSREWLPAIVLALDRPLPSVWVCPKSSCQERDVISMSISF